VGPESTRGQDQTSEDAHVEILRTLRRGVEPGIVLLHPGAVPMTSYSDLIRTLPPEPAVIAVDLERISGYAHAGLHPGQPVTISIEALAEQVLAALNGVITAAPWIVLGWSFGGNVAFDLPHRLEPDLRPRRLLVLDSLAPVPEFTSDSDDLDHRKVLGWFAMYLAAKRRSPRILGAERFADLDLGAGLAALATAGVEVGALRPGTTAEGLRKVYEAFEGGLLRNNRLARRYQPHRTTTPLDLVRPAEGMVNAPGALGWDRVAESVAVHECPGDHYSMLDHPEAVQTIARLCRSALGLSAPDTLDSTMDKPSAHA
jgi:thioesterase domain-containing protein